MVESLIRNSGLVVTKSPSIDHPIAISLSYRNNPDGSLCWLWPQGGKDAIFSKFDNINSLKDKLIASYGKVLFALGLGNVLAHGKLVLYADVPTATYITRRWGH